MAVSTYTSATIKGVTYSQGQSFVCNTTTTGKTDSEGNGGNSLQLVAGTTYQFYLYAVGDAVTHPYAVAINGSIQGWYTAAVFPPAKHTVSYNANGGTGAPSSQTKTWGSVLTLSSTKPTRKGYVFKGWGTSSTDTTADYQPGGNYGADSNITLYAIWEENILTMNYLSNYATAYCGTYEASNTVNNNNVIVYTRTYYYDNDYENGLLNYKETDSSIYMYKTGYTATGNWGTSTDGGILISQDDTTLNTGQKIAEAFNLTLENGNAEINVYAQWEENGLTVDYYSNYADYGTYQGDPLDVSASSNVLVYSKTYYYDDSYENGLNDIQNSDYLYLSRTGYFSTGHWGTAVNGGILIDEKKSFATGQELAEAFGLSLENGNESVTVRAQWEPANVAYYKNGDSYVLCNTYGKVNGSWQPMLFYGKTNGTWKRSVIEE